MRTGTWFHIRLPLVRPRSPCFRKKKQHLVIKGAFREEVEATVTQLLRLNAAAGQDVPLSSRGGKTDCFTAAPRRRCAVRRCASWAALFITQSPDALVKCAPGGQISRRRPQAHKSANASYDLRARERERRCRNARRPWPRWRLGVQRRRLQPPCSSSPPPCCHLDTFTLMSWCLVQQNGYRHKLDGRAPRHNSDVITIKEHHMTVGKSGIF